MVFFFLSSLFFTAFENFAYPFKCSCAKRLQKKMRSNYVDQNKRSTSKLRKVFLDNDGIKLFLKKTDNFFPGWFTFVLLVTICFLLLCLKKLFCFVIIGIIFINLETYVLVKQFLIFYKYDDLIRIVNLESVIWELK